MGGGESGGVVAVVADGAGRAVGGHEHDDADHNGNRAVQGQSKYLEWRRN